MLNNSSQIIKFLNPATAQCKALAQQFDLNPNDLTKASDSTDLFDVMVGKLVNSKQVTPKQLADALESPLVGYGQLARKVKKYKPGELLTK